MLSERQQSFDCMADAVTLSTAITVNELFCVLPIPKKTKELAHTHTEVAHKFVPQRQHTKVGPRVCNKDRLAPVYWLL